MGAVKSDFKRLNLQLKMKEKNVNTFYLNFQGPLYNDSMAFVEKIRHHQFKEITQANQKLCGSGQNGIVEAEEGTTMCVRYENSNLPVYGKP